MIKVTKVKGGFDDLMAKLVSKSHSDTANVGWFASDGKHPTADMTYPELARYHATGSEGVPIRDVLNVAKVWFGGKKHERIDRAFTKYLLSGKDSDFEALVDAVGKSFWIEAINTIGSSSRLATTNNPTPLVDSGSLKSNLKYNTSKKPNPRR